MNETRDRAAPTAPAGTAPLDSPDGRSTRWDTHREERRRELIKAARGAVHALGSDASMEDIAASCATSKSVFYRYFGDKAGLQQAVGEVVLLQMQRKIADAAQAAQTPRQGIHAMVSAYLQMAQTSPRVYTFVTAAGDSPYPAGSQNRDQGKKADTSASPTALGHFFDEVCAMIAGPMRALLAGTPHGDSVLSYWPTAAIGMVRNAGELWLSAAPSATKPDHEAMARQITAWLCLGVAPDLDTSASSKDNPTKVQNQ